MSDQYIIEAGANRNHIGKQLAYPSSEQPVRPRRRHFPYQKMSVMAPGPDGAPVEQPAQTAALNALLTRESLRIASVIGIDVHDPQIDPGINRSFRSQRFSIREAWRRRQLAEEERL